MEMKSLNNHTKEEILDMYDLKETSLENATKEDLIDLFELIEFLETFNLHELKGIAKVLGHERASYSKLRRSKLIVRLTWDGLSHYKDGENSNRLKNYIKTICDEKKKKYKIYRVPNKINRSK